MSYIEWVQMHKKGIAVLEKVQLMSTSREIILKNKPTDWNGTYIDFYHRKPTDSKP